MEPEQWGRDGYQRFIKFFVIIAIAFAFGFSYGRQAEQSKFVGWPDRVGEEKREGEGETIPGLTGQGVVLVGGNAIAVDDQPPGVKVEISMLTLAKDGWVVIHREVDGKPGGILSAQRFLAGENQKVTMELVKPTEEDKVYYAMLHADDGERGFDAKKDVPLTDPQGNVIMMRFVATSNPN